MSSWFVSGLFMALLAGFSPFTALSQAAPSATASGMPLEIGIGFADSNVDFNPGVFHNNPSPWMGGLPEFACGL